MDRRKRFLRVFGCFGVPQAHPECTPAAHPEAGVGLIEAMISAVIIVIASVGIFMVLDYADQQNASTASTWSSVQSGMMVWSQPPTNDTTSGTSSAASGTSVIAITVSGASGLVTESVPVAEAISNTGSTESIGSTQSTGSPYGWWRVSP